MNQRPLIGISSRLLQHKDLSSPLIGHHVPYARAIIQAGGVPLGLPLLEDQEIVERVVERFDGFLFTGGEDIDPALYGEKPHEKLGSLCRERDVVEIALLKQAYHTRKPTLAICRGIQVMNVALGGTLYQDLESQFPSSIEHRYPDDKVDGPRAQHHIRIDRQSLLAELLQTENLLVNSSHHQAVRDISPELRVVATAPDGVIEAVEGKGRQFFLGVQCHPEALVTGSDTSMHKSAPDPSPSALPEHFARWKRVFKSFIEECSKSK